MRLEPMGSHGTDPFQSQDTPTRSPCTLSERQQEAVDYLNELLRLDRDAMSRLVLTRVLCNEHLAHHPTLLMLGRGEEEYEFGCLGILNGLLLRDESNGFVVAAIVEDDVVKRFMVLRRERES